MNRSNSIAIELELQTAHCLAERASPENCARHGHGVTLTWRQHRNRTRFYRHPPDGERLKLNLRPFRVSNKAELAAELPPHRRDSVEARRSSSSGRPYRSLNGEGPQWANLRRLAGSYERPLWVQAIATKSVDSD